MKSASSASPLIKLCETLAPALDRIERHVRKPAPRPQQNERPKPSTRPGN